VKSLEPSRYRVFSSIRFDDVSFSYEGNGDGAREILRNINLKVKAGEVLAVVGSSAPARAPSASDPALFDVTSGALLIDGRDVAIRPWPRCVP